MQFEWSLSAVSLWLALAPRRSGASGSELWQLLVGSPGQLGASLVVILLARAARSFPGRNPAFCKQILGFGGGLPRQLREARDGGRKQGASPASPGLPGSLAQA